MQIAKKNRIITDTHEKQALDFSNYEDEFEVINKKLATGDYTIEGLEDKLCIERKASVSEIARNVCEKRFKRELDRMLAFKYRFIVCEFSITDILRFPLNCDLPAKIKSKIKITGNFILACLTQFAVKYNIHIIYAGNKHTALEYIIHIFKRVIKNEIPN